MGWAAVGRRPSARLDRRPRPPHLPTHSAHPIAPSAATAALKAAGVKGPKHKRATTARSRVAWRFRAFDNPARSDGLRLSHWTKCLLPAAAAAGVADAAAAAAAADPPPFDGGKPYPFAAFDRHPKALRYDDEEWGAVVPRDGGWTREETDYLLDSLDRFGLRFLVVSDRYDVRGG